MSEYKTIFLRLWKKFTQDISGMFFRAKKIIISDINNFSNKNKPLYPEGSAKALGPYAPAFDTGSFVFFSGQIAMDSDGVFHDESLKSESAQVFRNIDVLLKAAECKKENIVKATIFLSDLNNFKEFNDLYAEYLGSHKPARSCVQVVLPKNARVEVEVIVKK